MCHTWFLLKVNWSNYGNSKSNYTLVSLLSYLSQQPQDDLRPLRRKTPDDKVSINGLSRDKLEFRPGGGRLLCCSLDTITGILAQLATWDPSRIVALSAPINRYYVSLWNSCVCTLSLKQLSGPLHKPYMSGEFSVYNEGMMESGE